MKATYQLGLVFLLAVILGACSLSEQKPRLKTLDKQVVNFAKLDNKRVLINYWADWCAPCKKEIPELNAFQKAHQDILVLGVNFDGVSPARQRELVEKNHIAYQSLAEDPSEALGLEDIPAIPVSFVFNRHGELVEALYGEQTQVKLEKAFAKVS